MYPMLSGYFDVSQPNLLGVNLDSTFSLLVYSLDLAMPRKKKSAAAREAGTTILTLLTLTQKDSCSSSNACDYFCTCVLKCKCSASVHNSDGAGIVYNLLIDLCSHVFAI